MSCMLMGPLVACRELNKAALPADAMGLATIAAAGSILVIARTWIRDGQPGARPREQYGGKGWVRSEDMIVQGVVTHERRPKGHGGGTAWRAVSRRHALTCSPAPA